MIRTPSPLLRLWQRYVNRWRKRQGWERVDTGELGDLHPRARITRRLPVVPKWRERK